MTKLLTPDYNCPDCPRLMAFREENKAKFPDWHNGPVDSFGSENAQLLVVGLAPGLRGANRTGRPFTGDFAGDLLYDTLKKYGFASGTYDRRPDDGFELVNARITNAVRCLPPENKPTGPEINACRKFLIPEMTRPGVRVLIALGRIAHESILRSLGLKLKDYPFGHNAVHHINDTQVMVDSYHCSKYNTSTKRLTESMFCDVFESAKKNL